jgi:hypothetical protein
MNQNNGQVHPVFQDIFTGFGMTQNNAQKIVQELKTEHLEREMPERLIRDVMDVEVHRVVPTIESHEEVNRIKQIVDAGDRFTAIMQSYEQGDITVFEAETLFEQLDRGTKT